MSGSTDDEARELLDSSRRLTRSLLGVDNDPTSLPAGGAADSLPPGGCPRRGLG